MAGGPQCSGQVYTYSYCAVHFKTLGSSKSPKTLPANELCNFSSAHCSSISPLSTYCGWHSVFTDCIYNEHCITAYFMLHLMKQILLSFHSKFSRTPNRHQLSYPLGVCKLFRAKTAIWSRFTQFKTLAHKQR